MPQGSTLSPLRPLQDTNLREVSRSNWEIWSRLVFLLHPQSWGDRTWSFGHTNLVIFQKQAGRAASNKAQVCLVSEVPPYWWHKQHSQQVLCYQTVINFAQAAIFQHFPHYRFHILFHRETFQMVWPNSHLPKQALPKHLTASPHSSLGANC